MNDRRSTDHLLSAWFEAEAPGLRAGRPANRHRPRDRPRSGLGRPGWRAWEGITWTSSPAARDAATSRLVPILALLGLLIAAAVGRRLHRLASARTTWRSSRRRQAPRPPRPRPAAHARRRRLRSVVRGPRADDAVPDPAGPARTRGKLRRRGRRGHQRAAAPVYRVNTSTNSRSLVVDDIPVGPRDHVSFAASATGSWSGTTKAVARSATTPRAASSWVSPRSVSGRSTQLSSRQPRVVPELRGRFRYGRRSGGPARRSPSRSRSSTERDRSPWRPSRRPVCWAVSPSSPTLVRDQPGDRVDRARGTVAGRDVLWCRHQHGSGLGHTMRGFARPCWRCTTRTLPSRGPNLSTSRRACCPPCFEHDDRVWFATEDRTNRNGPRRSSRWTRRHWQSARRSTSALASASSHRQRGVAHLRDGPIPTAARRTSVGLRRGRAHPSRRSASSQGPADVRLPVARALVDVRELGFFEHSRLVLRLRL